MFEDWFRRYKALVDEKVFNLATDTILMRQAFRSVLIVTRDPSQGIYLGSYTNRDSVTICEVVSGAASNGDLIRRPSETVMEYCDRHPTTLSLNSQKPATRMMILVWNGMHILNGSHLKTRAYRLLFLDGYGSH